MRTLLRCLLLLLGLTLATAAAWSQSFPDRSKPLRIVVPAGVGSASDLLARVYGREIAERSGWPVVVENRPGAEGAIGVQAVRAAPADGYTIMMTTSSTQVVNPVTIPNLPYDPVADFVPLAATGVATSVLWINPALPFRTASELFAAARANPGKYSYGSSTSSARMASEMIEFMAGIRMLPVAFKTVPEMLTAVAAGQVDLAIASVSGGDGLYKGGRLRPLGVTGSSRLPALPDVPTLHEAGLPGYDMTTWFATYAPAGTPPAVAAALRDILRAAGNGKPVADFLSTSGMQRLELAGDQLTELQRREVGKLGQMMRASQR